MRAYNADISATRDPPLCAERSDGTMTSRSRGTWTSHRSTQCCRCADIVPTYCYLGAGSVWFLTPICWRRMSNRFCQISYGNSVTSF